MAIDTLDRLGTDARIRLAVEATWEIEALGQALIEASQELTAEHLAIRGLSIRVKDLACAAMSALDDDQDPIADIRSRVTGQPSGEDGRR